MDSMKPCQFCQKEMPFAASRCPSCQAKQPGSRLHRAHGDKVIAGVCAALADELGMDASIIRIFFAIAGLVSLGTVFWAYALLWVLIPERLGVPSPASRWMAQLRAFLTGPKPQPVPGDRIEP